MYFEGEQAKFKTAKGNTCFEALQSFAVTGVLNEQFLENCLFVSQTTH